MHMDLEDLPYKIKKSKTNHSMLKNFWRGLRKITMVTQVTKVKKLYIKDLEELDPISVFLEDFSPGQGQITILCFGKAWTSYWGAMGANDISSFFCSCNNDYILKKMLEKTYETDFDRINEVGRENGLDLCVESNVEVALSTTEMIKCFGEEWYLGLPTCHTSDYKYLSRIINEVKKAIQQIT